MEMERYAQDMTLAELERELEHKIIDRDRQMARLEREREKLLDKIDAIDERLARLEQVRQIISASAARQSATHTAAPRPRKRPLDEVKSLTLLALTGRLLTQREIHKRIINDLDGADVVIGDITRALDALVAENKITHVGRGLFEEA